MTLFRQMRLPRRKLVGLIQSILVLAGLLFMLRVFAPVDSQTEEAAQIVGKIQYQLAEEENQQQQRKHVPQQPQTRNSSDLKLLQEWVSSPAMHSI